MGEESAHSLGWPRLPAMAPSKVNNYLKVCLPDGECALPVFLLALAGLLSKQGDKQLWRMHAPPELEPVSLGHLLRDSV